MSKTSEYLAARHGEHWARLMDQTAHLCGAGGFDETVAAAFGEPIDSVRRQIQFGLVPYLQLLAISGGEAVPSPVVGTLIDWLKGSDDEKLLREIAQSEEKAPASEEEMSERYLATLQLYEAEFDSVPDPEIWPGFENFDYQAGCKYMDN